MKPPPTDKPVVWERTPYTNLVRYIPSGTLFARFSAHGKLVRQSLETQDLQMAKRRLDELVTLERSNTGPRTGRFTVGQCVKELRERGFRVSVGPTTRGRKPIKSTTILYYNQRLTALLKDWPELEATLVRKVTNRDLEIWATRFARENPPSVFNNTLALLRQIFQIGVESGVIHINPAMKIGRMGERPKKLQLPTVNQFEPFVTAIAEAGSGWSAACADLVRFLAYSGMRKGEASEVRWEDCNFEKGRIMVWGHPENRTKGGLGFRALPMIQEMAILLKRLRAERPDAKPTDPVMTIRECQKSMDTAAKSIGMTRITHHDLRHLFATICIERGVDIQTVSRWLGHKDGGVLAMKTYGHLRDEHSFEMAARVTFGVPKNAE